MIIFQFSRWPETAAGLHVRHMRSSAVQISSTGGLLRQHTGLNGGKGRGTPVKHSHKQAPEVLFWKSLI